jgi:hypothetical protein
MMSVLVAYLAPPMLRNNSTLCGDSIDHISNFRSNVTGKVILGMAFSPVG